MTDRARQKAESCFALARSTTHDGERENAIALGTRIAEAAGLSLDLFDIPGRARSKPKQRTRAEAEAVVRRYEEEIRRRFDGAMNNPSAWARRGSIWGDSDTRYRRDPSEAMRAFNESINKAAGSARAQSKVLRVKAALEVVRSAGARVDPDPGGGGWIVAFSDGMGIATDDMLLELARKVKERKEGKA